MNRKRFKWAHGQPKIIHIAANMGHSAWDMLEYQGTLKPAQRRKLSAGIFFPLQGFTVRQDE